MTRCSRCSFSQVRIGLGTSKVVKELDTNELGRREDYEPVTYDASSAFLQTQSKLHNAPKPLLLRNIAGMALIGRDGMDPVYGLARAMICQAAVAHSPRDFKIMIVTDDIARWEWCKWLPHCAHPTQRDRGGPDADGVVDRGADGRRGRHGTARRDAFRTGATTTPHWLVIDDRRRRGDDRHWETLTRAGGVAGVTFLALSDEPGRGVGFDDDEHVLGLRGRGHPPRPVVLPPGHRWIWPARGCWLARWPVTGLRANDHAA